jgi:hypothetical protein
MHRAARNMSPSRQYTGIDHWASALRRGRCIGAGALMSNACAIPMIDSPTKNAFRSTWKFIAPVVSEYRRELPTVKHCSKTISIDTRHARAAALADARESAEMEGFAQTAREQGDMSIAMFHVESTERL